MERKENNWRREVSETEEWDEWMCLDERNRERKRGEGGEVECATSAIKWRLLSSHVSFNFIFMLEKHISYYQAQVTDGMWIV